METTSKVVVNVNGENESSGDGRPPNHPLSSACKQRFNTTRVASPCKMSLLRHPSLVKVKTTNILEQEIGIEDSHMNFTPIVRSGAWADIGFRSSMEDVYLCVDNVLQDYAVNSFSEGPHAFYGVFDGHGGKHAADFACCHLPKFIFGDEDFPREIERAITSAFLQTDTAFAEACKVFRFYCANYMVFDGHGGKHAADFACCHLPKFIFGDEDFPREIERAVTSAFLQTDTAFAEACLLDANLASGTTALAALVVGSSLVVANAGDCRAVLSRRGQAIEMSRDHKPFCMKESNRIEASGGYVYDGYLNGQLNVARALGDWHMEGLKCRDGGPLSAEPEFMSTRLTEEDEFLIIGCDGLWDVFRSQNAVDFARRRLQEHNDPAMCCKELVDEALKRETGDNLAVVVVCFHSQPPPNLVAPRTRVQRSISGEGLRELQSFLDSL
ncbi:PPM-type phosphatase-like domain, partial [Dillenia turbinata]